MSCYLVTDKHLSAIVRWACRANLKAGFQKGRYTYTPGQEQQAVDLLHAANVRSVNQRYGGDTQVGGAQYDPGAPDLSPIEVVKACEGFAYQCDEWEGFEGSAAQRLITDIQSAAIRQLKGYENAQWSIE